jgi:hypothetical protein
MHRLHRRRRAFGGTRKCVPSRHGVAGFRAGATELPRSNRHHDRKQHHTKVSTGRVLKTAALEGTMTVVIRSPISLTITMSTMLHTRFNTAGNVGATVL